MSDFTLDTAQCTTFDRLPDFDVPRRRVPGRARFPSRGRWLSGSPSSFKTPKKIKPDSASQKESLEIRSYFPETWLWELQDIGTSGEMALKRKLPHTITEWMGTAVCIHHKQGLGISDVAKIVSYQPFFASFTLPYSVIKGEIVPVVVSVFNYISECLPIKLSLELSESFRIINSSSSELCVCGEKSKSHKFYIQPTSIGSVNITAYAYSVTKSGVCENEITATLGGRDAVTRSLLVEAEGFPKEDVFNTFFCPQNSNGSYSEEFDLLLPDNVVENSQRCYVSLTGDLMGPALNGIEKLICLPVGCGEQNMVLFTPNIYILDYLKNTGRPDKDIEQKALNYMKTGYQRELGYRHDDGSYSAFGKSDKEGSLWLTAFVVRSFSSARRFISIDEHDLMFSIRWILQKQLENGCFPLTGRILHKELQGGLIHNEDDESLAPLTAYVMISLLESGFNIQTVAKNAFYCMKLSPVKTDYAIALYAYAAALAKDPNAEEHLAKLEERAISIGNQMYWSHTNKAISVEIAAYAILTILELGITNNPNLVYIVHWVAQQRNSNGGFYSTQDTVVALQALAKYASLVARNPSNIGVAIEADDFVRGFKIDETNKLLMQTTQLPVLPTVVDFQAAGEGCGLVQFSLKYNVHTAEESDLFELHVKGSREGSSDCNVPSIGICMRYKVPGQESNMAVVEVKMMSGYVPNEWSLHKLKANENLELKRHEFRGNLVNLYFTKLTNEQRCFRFLLKPEIKIEDPKEATVKLYDYYNPEHEIIKNYSIPSECSSHPLPEFPFVTTVTATTTETEKTTSEMHFTTTLSPSTTPFYLSTEVSTEASETVPNEHISTATEKFDTEVHDTTLSELYKGSESVGDESTLSQNSTEAINDYTTTPESLEPEDSSQSAVNESVFSQNVTAVVHDDTTTPESLELENNSQSAVNVSVFSQNVTAVVHYDTTTPESLEPENNSQSDVNESVLSQNVTAAVHDVKDLKTEPQPTFTTETSVLDSHTPTLGEVLLADQAHIENYHTLQNFIDFNETLDFPDGIEGNLPAYVTPPRGLATAEMFSKLSQATGNCPVCLSEFPDNFSSIYCNSQALKVKVKDLKHDVIKILQDISFHHRKPVTIGEFSVMSYDRSCDCPLIRTGARFFIFGQPNYLWTKGGSRNTLHVTSDVHIIPSRENALPPQLMAARSRCSSASL